MTYPLPPFALHCPDTVDEALTLAGAHPGALYLAGGTDLMVNLRRRIHEPGHVIDLKGVAELRGIAREGDVITIGALTSIAEVASDPLVAEHLPVLAEAAGVVAGPTLRGMGTLGGNLCLDTRCRYYNQSFFWRQANDFCLKKDGDVCHVAPGGSFCWAAYAGDTGPALLLLDATVELSGPDGERTVPLAEFHGKDGRSPIGADPDPKRQGGKRPGELLLRVRVPLPEPGWVGVYEKLRVRDSIDYPLVGVALMARFEGGKDAGGNGPGAGNLTGLRMALTAVNPRPEPVPGLEAYLGQPLTPAVLDGLKSKANRTGKPMRTSVADPAYRRAMVGALLEKAAVRLSPSLGKALAKRAQGA